MVDMVKIDFARGEEPVIFRDALHIPADVYSTMTEDEVKAMQDERYENWKAFVEAASNALPIEPIIEEPIAEGDITDG